MTVCVSPGGTNQYATSQPSTELLVGTADGIVFLNRSSASAPWHQTRRELEGKHISALMLEPRSGAIFAGTHEDGLHVSKDGGRTWGRTDRGIQFPNIYSLNYVEADATARVYAGTEPAHLYVSKNLGDSWTELPALRSVPSVEKWTFPGPPHEGHVKNITFDPRSADTILASIEVGGLLKSQDAGKTWRDLEGGYYEDVHRVMVPAARPDDVFMATGNGIYHSADAGDTWERLTDETARIAYPDALLIKPDDPNTMFMAGASCSPGTWRETRDANARIARSRDAGRTWEYLERGLPEHIRGNVEAMSMNTWQGGLALFAATTDGDVFHSGDEGETWSTIASGLPPISKSGHFRNLRGGDRPMAAAAH